MASTRLLLEGSDIEALLARVRDEHGPGARIVHADKVRTGGVAGFFARERYAVTVEVPDPARAAAPAAPVATERPVDAPGTLLEMADAIDAAEAAEAEVVLSTAGVAPAARFETRTVSAAGSPGELSTEGRDFAAVLAGIAEATRGPEPEHAAAGAARPFVPRDVRRPAVASRGIVSRLVRLGLPRAIAENVDDDGSIGLHGSLVGALSALPKPPPVRLEGGDIMVVAGEGMVAYDVACRVARRLRLDQSRVLLAAPSALGTGIPAARRVSGPADARRRSARLQRCDVPTVVAVDAPCDGQSAAWARDVADAFGARAAWALVDATRKPADVLDHIRALGRLDGLVVHATAATRDPASVIGTALELRLPTVLLEERRGTAAAWAALLIERLGEQP
jgi:hypothetical protein